MPWPNGGLFDNHGIQFVNGLVDHCVKIEQQSLVADFTE
jgi:hypothetical protein